MNLLLKRALCPHRGLGEENGINAIKAAVRAKPFMVEFDIQNINGVLHLGHPPKINYESTLKDALLVYDNSIVLPKIDLKCNTDWKSDVDLLLAETQFTSRDLLVNLAGENLDTAGFMNAENYLLLNSKSTILLNIDTRRYKGEKLPQIYNHINSLSRKPFSLSPMLESKYDADIDIASNCNIHQIHFWSNNSVQYSENKLLSILDKYSRLGFQVYFDINPSVVTLSP